MVLTFDPIAPWSHIGWFLLAALVVTYAVSYFSNQWRPIAERPAARVLISGLMSLAAVLFA